MHAREMLLIHKFSPISDILLYGSVEDLEELMQNHDKNFSSHLKANSHIYLKAIFEGCIIKPDVSILEVVKIFLNDSRVDINKYDAKNEPLIVTAITTSNLILSSHNALLFHERVKDYTNALEFLFAHPKLDVNIYNPAGEHILLLAIEMQAKKIVELLLARSDIIVDLPPEYTPPPEIEELLEAKRTELLINNVKVCEDDLAATTLLNNEDKISSEEVEMGGSNVVAEGDFENL